MHDFYVDSACKKCKRIMTESIFYCTIEDYLEEGPEFYDSDMVTDQPEKQIAAEIIREKLLWLLDKEVPRPIAIEITKMQEKEKLQIFTTDNIPKSASHKGIIIGKHGEMLKKIGTMARGDIEKMLDKKVYHGTLGVLKSDWRNE